MSASARGKKQISRFLPFLMVALAAAAAVLPLFFFKGIPFGDDLDFHLGRLTSIAECLKAGNLRPGVYPKYFGGMGYGLGLFYPGFFLYPFAALTLGGLSVIDAYKLWMITSVIAAGAAMFFAVRRLGYDVPAAALSALCVMLSSYHTTDLYLRNAFGEVMAFVFLPLIIAEVLRIIDGKGNPAVLAFFAAGMLLSHVLSAVMTALLCAVLILTKIRDTRRKTLADFGLAALLALGMAAVFVIPFTEQYLSSPVWGDTGLLGSIDKWAVPIQNAFLALPTDLGNNFAPPAGIGIGLVAVGVLGLIFGDGTIRRLSAIAFVFLLMSTDLFPWRVLAPALGTLQFPWRLYLIVTVCLCMCAGPVGERIAVNRNVYVLALAAVMMISFAYNANALVNKGIDETENSHPYFPAGCEYLPQGANYGDILARSQNPEPSFSWQGSAGRVFVLDAGEITLPVIYYPGYTAKAGGRQLAVGRTADGYVTVNTEGLPPGEEVSLTYPGTWLFRAAPWLSIAALLVTVIVAFERDSGAFGAIVSKLPFGRRRRKRT